MKKQSCGTRGTNEIAATIKERPILFSGPMVRAILSGKKTQTRRVVRPQPPQNDGLRGPELYEPTKVNRHGEEYPGDPVFGVYDVDGEWGCACPFGQPGDRLWVRETWREADDREFGICIEYRADGRKRKPKWPTPNDGWKTEQAAHAIDAHKWRPFIHMPRWASRITLEVTGVRVERLQDISSIDIRAEGVEPAWDEFEYRTIDMEGWEEPEELIEEQEEECDWINYGRRLVHSSEHQEWERDREHYARRIAFELLWNDLNAKRGYPWESNPWVWVVEFKKLEAPSSAAN